MKIEIDYLTRHPEFIDELARLWQSEWSSDKSEAGFLKQYASIEKKLNAGKVPMILIAYDDNKLLGSVALFKYDLKSHRHLTPWIGGVLVLPDYRGQGIARQLMERGENEAQKLGFNKLYLHTETVGDLYRKLGWIKIDECSNDQGIASEVFEKEL